MKTLNIILLIMLSALTCNGGVHCTGKEEKPKEDVWNEEASQEESPRKASMIDLALIYGGGAHRNVVWNREHFTPYVSYTDRNNQEHWLFDGFLLLEIVDGKGKIFATGYHGTPATKNEWKALADYYFKPGQCVDALNKCITEKISTLGNPSTACTAMMFSSLLRKKYIIVIKILNNVFEGAKVVFFLKVTSKFF